MDCPYEVKIYQGQRKVKNLGDATTDRPYAGWALVRPSLFWIGEVSGPSIPAELSTVLEHNKTYLFSIFHGIDKSFHILLGVY